MLNEDGWSEQLWNNTGDFILSSTKHIGMATEINRSLCYFHFSPVLNIFTHVSINILSQAPGRERREVATNVFMVLPIELISPATPPTFQTLSLPCRGHRLCSLTPVHLSPLWLLFTTPPLFILPPFLKRKKLRRKPASAQQASTSKQ